MKILVIEDNPDTQYLVRYLLETRGHLITEARSGPEGIAAVRAAVPDLILLDIELPQMSGYAVAGVMRGNPALDAVPIVAFTAYAMRGDRAKALAAGFDHHIEKPIDPDTFANVLEAVATTGRGTGNNGS